MTDDDSEFGGKDRMFGPANDPLTDDNDDSDDDSEELSNTSSDAAMSGSEHAATGTPAVDYTLAPGPDTTPLPLIYGRDQNNIRAGRNQLSVAVYRDTERLLRDTKADLEDELGQNVSAMDFREIALRVAVRDHLEEIVEEAKLWGYGLTRSDRP